MVEQQELRDSTNQRERLTIKRIVQNIFVHNDFDLYTEYTNLGYNGTAYFILTLCFYLLLSIIKALVNFNLQVNFLHFLSIVN